MYIKFVVFVDLSLYFVSDFLRILMHAPVDETPKVLSMI
jgi:hypothetical protein